MTKKFKSLDKCLDNHLRERAALLEQMTHSARQSLPPSLAEHCWVTGYNHDVVDLITDETAFANSIQYRQKALVAQLNKDFSKRLDTSFRKANIRSARSQLFIDRP